MQNICKSFGSTEVLKGINLSVKEGEFIDLVGPSGCGKSTLLNIIAGLESTNEGDLLLDGLDIKTIEPKDPEPLNLSSSKIETYNTCPRKYRIKFFIVIIFPTDFAIFSLFIVIKPL